jgi:hypothetical protein
MLKAKVKIKASGKDAEGLMGSLPQLGNVKPQVKVEIPKKKRPVPSRRGF